MRSTNTWRRPPACWEGGTGNEFTMGAESETNTPFGAAPVANDVDGQINKYISGYSQPVQSTVAVNYTTQAWMSNKALSPVVCRFNRRRRVRVPGSHAAMDSGHQNCSLLFDDIEGPLPVDLRRI